MSFNEHLESMYASHISKEDRVKIMKRVLSLIHELEEEDKICNYFDCEKMMKDLLITIYNNFNERKNLCVVCEVDMGVQNPRQLCGKTYCNGLLNDID